MLRRKWRLGVLGLLRGFIRSCGHCPSALPILWRFLVMRFQILASEAHERQGLSQPLKPTSAKGVQELRASKTKHFPITLSNFSAIHVIFILQVVVHG